MRNYEVTFIVDPVLSSDEIKSTARSYVDMIKGEDAKIVHEGEMGLRQLAYPINRRTTGIYYCVEFEVETGAMIEKMELAMRRDERIMRFLTVALDKYGVKYNADKRAGKIGTKKKKETKEETPADKKAAPAKSAKPVSSTTTKSTEAPKAAKETVTVKETVKVAAPAATEAVVTETVTTSTVSSEEE